MIKSCARHGYRDISMKKIAFLVFACFISVFAKAQTKENVTKIDGIITISEVVTVENTTADEIYNAIGVSGYGIEYIKSIETAKNNGLFF